MRGILVPALTTLLVVVCWLGVAPGYAASHNDAPLIMQDPPANIADVYAFVAIEDGVKSLDLIMTVNPLEEPGNGVNYYRFADDVLYSISIVKGTRNSSGAVVFNGKPAFTYNFRFTTAYKNKGTILSYGRGTEVGAINNVGDARQNLVQTYKVEKVNVPKGITTELSKGQVLLVPPVNAGPRTTPFYYDQSGNLIQGSTDFTTLDRYTRQSIFKLTDGSFVQCGQRDDGFYADVPAIFDLLGLRNPGNDGFNGYNVHVISFIVPLTAILTQNDIPMVGVYATTSRRQTTIRNSDKPNSTSGSFVQVGRMGNPLFNETLVALKDKDRYNQLPPSSDASIFTTYAANPELAVLINTVFGTSIQTTNRTDLVNIFIPDLLKVDTSTGAVPLPGRPGFSRLSFLGGDTIFSPFQNKLIPSGWPNGRRLGDDVVDIALTAVASGPTFNPIIPISDNVDTNDLLYNQTFPYHATPHGGPTSLLHDGDDQGLQPQ